jgi:protein kinase-like protein
MPIGIGVNGGLLRQQVLEGVDSKEALQSLQNIRTHLSQPGRDSGVLTLFNRTSTETEMTLERKSSFQLLFGKKDRLDDTVHALRTMLTRAGKDEALTELDNYLEGQGGKHNRVESSKMLEILNRHLPTKAPSLDGLYEMAKIDKSKELGRGAYGTTFLVNVGRKEQVVLKEFDKPQPLTLDRSSKPNEAMGSYLTSRKQPNYLTDKVNISQPTSYLISVKKDEGEQYQMVTPHTMRRLVKDAKQTNSTVMCHGIIMPKARGKEVDQLIGLSETEKKQVVRSTLLSIKGLNERGFVHRDIKPQNSLFDRETETTTLIDTGMLFKTGKDQEKHPGSKFIGEYGGTMRYVHPRGLRNEEHGTEADLHALGVMALEVDHPGIFKILGEPMLAGVTKEWLLKKIDQKIEDNPRNRDKLEALRDSINNPDTISGFAMLCIEKAGLPKDDWSNRDWAQQTYTQLLDHPVLQ